MVDAADAQGAQARLRSKQLLLDMLVERIRCAELWGPYSTLPALLLCLLYYCRSWPACARHACFAHMRILAPAPPPCSDVSSYTRVAVLQTWGYLAEHRALPLGHWQLVTDIAIGALLLLCISCGSC